MFQLSKSKHINFVALHRAADNLTGSLFPLIKKRRRLRRVYKILKYFGLAAVVLLLVLLILFSAKILSLREFYNQGISGQRNLEQAVVSAEQDDYDQAMALAGAAQNNFDSLLNELGSIKNDGLVKRFPLAMNQLEALESLLTANRFLSQAVYGGAGFGKNLAKLLPEAKKLNFSQFNPAARRQILGKIFESAPELNGIKANLVLADLELNRVDLAGIFSPLKEKITQTKDQIAEAEQLLEKAVPLAQLLPVLAGYPDETQFLTVLQNAGELRPTGGVLEAYGILHFKDGDITSFNTHDVRSLDALAQAKIKLIPPEPIKEFTDQWSLRDANWSPDWPTAAQKIYWFYQKESVFNPAAEKISQADGVMAFTPKLITDFLKVTGPVSVQGQVYDQTNFSALAESHQEVIGEIVKELKNKIFAWPAKDWPKVINLLADNLAAKDLLFYFNDEQLENIAALNGWGGEIKSTAGDYLMVVDANLSGAKTDIGLSRGLEYKVAQGANGLFSKLILNYAYAGAARQGVEAYKSYTRVYAPLGSQLISLSGYEPNQIEIGNEAGRTWFGFYLEVQPGAIKNLTLDYKLPVLAFTPKNYELYLQKQPGKEISEVRVDLSFLNDIKSYSPVSLYMLKLDSTRLKWEGDLSIDRSFEVKF